VCAGGAVVCCWAGNNYFLNRINFAPIGEPLPGQVNVTDEEYNALVFAHVTELWSRFG
jgi:hypothetical protein